MTPAVVAVENAPAGANRANSVAIVASVMEDG